MFCHSSVLVAHYGEKTVYRSRVLGAKSRSGLVARFGEKAVCGLRECVGGYDTRVCDISLEVTSKWRSRPRWYIALLVLNFSRRSHSRCSTYYYYQLTSHTLVSEHPWYHSTYHNTHHTPANRQLDYMTSRRNPACCRPKCRSLTHHDKVGPAEPRRRTELFQALQPLLPNTASSLLMAYR